MEVDDFAFGMHLVLKRLVMANKENDSDITDDQKRDSSFLGLRPKRTLLELLNVLQIPPPPLSISRVKSNYPICSNGNEKCIHL